MGSKGDPSGAASGMIFDSFGCQVASLRAAQRPPGCGRSPGFPLRSLRAERAAAVESARWLRGSPDMSLHPIRPLRLGLAPATLAVARCAQRTLRADALFAERGGRLGPQAGAGPTYEALVSTAVDLKVEHVVVLEQVDGPLPPQGGPRCQTAIRVMICEQCSAVRPAAHVPARVSHPSQDKLFADLDRDLRKHDIAVVRLSRRAFLLLVGFTVPALLRIPFILQSITPYVYTSAKFQYYSLIQCTLCPPVLGLALPTICCTLFRWWLVCPRRSGGVVQPDRQFKKLAERRLIRAYLYGRHCDLCPRPHVLSLSQVKWCQWCQPP